MDRNNVFVYIYDMGMIQSFFDPGLWPLAYEYVALNDVPNRWNFSSLKAPFWRMYWNDTKGAAIRLGQQTVPMLSGKLYIIPPNADFGSIHHGRCRQLYVHFQIRHPYSLRGPAIITLALTKQRRDFVRRIIAGHDSDEIGQRRVTLLIRALLETLLVELMDEQLVFRKIDQRLLTALNYLEGHLDQPADNPRLAALMHIHPQTMLRLFRAEIGKAPQEYLRQMRVDKACWFLKFSNDSIKAIAEKTGFCDRYHFTKIFTKSTGQSPARFRAGRKQYRPAGD